MEELLYRIFNRQIIIKINNIKYLIKAPSVSLRYEAELYKLDLIDMYKYELPRLDDYSVFLIKNRFIEHDYEKKIKDMNDTIKRFKVELYQAGPRTEVKKKIRKNLALMKDKLSKYYTNVEYYRSQSLEYFANILKNKYILTQTVFQNDALVFDINNLDLSLLNKITGKLNSLDISTAKFREIARSDAWRTYWLANKYDVFGIPAIEYSEDQKTLCMFSRFYSGLLENPDFPLSIIDDDDETDGFSILQHEQHNNKKNNVTNLDDRFQEVFIAAENEDEAASIYNANTADGKRILKERAQVLKSKDEVKDMEYLDVKLDILQQQNDGFINRFRK